jgi:NADH:ubiquinone oxidoreductase subunit 4 (subunit M)
MIFFIFKINISSSLNQLNIYLFFNKIFISIILFLFFVSFSVLNYLLDNYQDLVLVTVDYFDSKTEIEFLNIFAYNKLFTINGNSLNLVQVYFYPFIYVFLFVTVLSIIFCLTYNIDELLSFMFYCLIILVAGYILFFTDSMLLFFLSYEMLLVPSFFILYKFAKTRRCVEAAYLMFF